MNLKELQKSVKETSERHGYDQESLEQKLLLLMEELGELTKSVRKEVGTSVGEHSEIYDTPGEVADVLYVLVDVANLLLIDLEDVFTVKLHEINRRNEN